MDPNNNPIPPQPNQPSPVPTQPPVQAAPPEKDSKKIIIFLVLGIALVILVVGGIYYFLSKQQPVPETPLPEQTTNIPTSPTLVSIKDALDEELDSINVSASEGDFESVDQDLKTL